MALQSSGQITLNQIHLEAGGSSQTQASLNDADIRGLINKGSGAQMAMDEWYNASALPAYRSVSTGVIGSNSSNNSVESYSLTSLGAQQGDLVLVSICSDGPGSITPYNMSGWGSLSGTGTNVTFTQGMHFKVMGSSPESSFKITTGPYPFALPVVALCIKNIGGLATSYWSGGSGVISVNPPARSVTTANSVGVVVLLRDDNAAGVNASTPSGYTKIGSKYTSNAGLGYNWEQSVDVYYRLGLPTGTHDPSAISWGSGYDNAVATTAIFR
jgi:hypothetical protein